MTTMRFEILALDLDGTALDPDGRLTPDVCEAVSAAKRRGLHVVLCTGRRFRTALPMAQGLDLEGAIVVNNGAVVKDIATGETSHHSYLSSDAYSEILARLRKFAPPLVYVDAYHEQTDMFTENRAGAHAFQKEYLRDQGEFCRTVDDLSALRRDDVIMLSLMADEATLDAARSRVMEVLGDRVRTHSLVNKNYRGGILEFLSPGSGKWQGLCRVADELGAPLDTIAAIGDDTNDAEMIRRARLGIAMGNATPAALDAADEVVESNAKGGVVQAIERVLSRL